MDMPTERDLRHLYVSSCLFILGARGCQLPGQLLVLEFVNVNVLVRVEAIWLILVSILFVF